MAHTVAQHFDGRSQDIREIYDAILTGSRKFGPVEEDPKKTSIHLNRKSAFAGIQTCRDFLILTVKASDDIDSPRISKRERASANRWHHEVKLGRAGDVDAEVLGWLRDAYGLSG